MWFLLTVLVLSPIALHRNKNRVAEQHSVDVAWKLLMGDEYTALRAVIYTTDNELKRFRQLVVNAVMATDVMDKDLKLIRNNRWERAFAENRHDVDPSDTVCRKATIVIEHLLQASDVCHTMQHWHVYRKWVSQIKFELTEKQTHERFVPKRHAKSVLSCLRHYCRTRGFLGNVTKRTWMVEPRLIHPSTGTRANLVSLIFISCKSSQWYDFAFSRCCCCLERNNAF